MRIAFFTDTFLPQVNGVATSIANVAEELGKQGHQVLIFAPRTKRSAGPVFRAKGVTVVRFLSIPALVYPDFRLSVFGLPKVMRTLRKFKPDILHFHTPITVGTYALEAAYLLRKPLIGTNHIYLTKHNHDFFKSMSTNPLAIKFMVSIVLHYFRLFYDACDLWIAPSQRLIVELQESGFKKDMRCLPNGIPLDKIVRLTQKQREAMRAKYGLKRKVVLHFGRLSAEKCIDDVLRGFASATKGGMQASLLLIGDGPHRAHLEQLAEDLGIAKHTVFLGAIPHRRLLSSGIISLADVFVTASTMESQGMVIVEAMASGVPVIGVRQAAADEVIREAGLLADPGNSRDLGRLMKHVVQDPKLAKRLSEKGLQAAQRYSVETMAAQLLSIYEEVRARKRKDRSRLSRYLTILLGNRKIRQ